MAARAFTTARDSKTRQIRAELALICAAALLFVSSVVIMGHWIGPPDQQAEGSPFLIDPYYVMIVTPLVVFGIVLVAWLISKQEQNGTRGKAKKTKAKKGKQRPRRRTR